MKKFRCTVCGYIHEGDAAPEKCPLCKAPASKFVEVEEQTADGPLVFADEHVIGVAKGCDDEMIKDLNNHFMGECTEVGMYLAMSRQADREGYPEIAEAYKRYAWEEAEHAAKFAELLGDCVWDTKTNLEKRMAAECGACEDKKRIATRAKALNLDAIHDTVHEMAKDETLHTECQRKRMRHVRVLFLCPDISISRKKSSPPCHVSPTHSSSYCKWNSRNLKYPCGPSGRNC